MVVDPSNYDDINVRSLEQSASQCRLFRKVQQEGHFAKTEKLKDALQDLTRLIVT